MSSIPALSGILITGLGPCSFRIKLLNGFAGSFFNLFFEKKILFPVFCDFGSGCHWQITSYEDWEKPNALLRVAFV
jgi:hypothetical protein